MQGEAGAWLGPWVQMALFCEKVVVDKEDVLTVVRVVDRIIRSAQGPNPPAEMEPFVYQLMLVVTLKPGEARGRGTVAIDFEGPDGLTRPGPSLSVLFESPDRGHSLIMEAQLRFEQEGLYWFNVRYEGQLITRMPLRVVYQLTSAPRNPAQ